MSTTETWVINSNPNLTSCSITATFTSYIYGSLPGAYTAMTVYGDAIDYTHVTGDTLSVYELTPLGASWSNNGYRTVIFSSPVDTTTTFGQWLSANATKQ